MATLSEILQSIKAARSILVTSHDRPDGDAIGSAVAMGLLLESIGKSVEIVNTDKVPPGLRFLPCSDRVARAAGRSEADLVIALDSAGRDRIGDAVWAMVGDAVPVINIDHHISNTAWGTQNYIDSESPATGQIVAELANAAGWSLDAAIAENLLVAISTDTGSFRYPSTSAKTFEIAGRLTACGLDIGRINRDTYESYPIRRLELMQSLLDGMQIDFDGRCVTLALPLEKSVELELEPSDTEGALDIVRAIDSVIVAVLFEELPDRRIRVSSRSKNESVSVGEVCAVFGGGGHTLAAGARMTGPIADARDRFLGEVKDRLAAVARSL